MAVTLEALITAGLAAAFIVYLRLLKVTAIPPGISRVGKPGLIGYLSTALRYTLDAEPVMKFGREQFSGHPFAVPTLAGSVIVLGPEYLGLLRSSDDTVFNQPMAINEDLQLKYTMDAHQMANPYQARVTRTEVTRSIPAFIPEILDEVELALNHTLTPSKGANSVKVPVFQTMTHSIARISNRVMFGTALCRNEEFIRAIVHFSETTPLYAAFLHWSPVVLRSAVYLLLSLIFGGKQGALKFIVPFLERYRAERRVMTEKPEIIAEFLIRNAPPEETSQGLAVRLMNLNFGSIHTSSIFITQALFELAILPKDDINEIRNEIVHALESQGGWNKSTLSGCRKIDSVLREVGRFHGLMQFALPRFVVSDYRLPDGTTIPSGYKVAVDMKTAHFNPEVYPEPYSFDPFRFAKLRQDDEPGNEKNAFATIDSHLVFFGAGRHACAGRFFAAMELKLILAHILLNYDLALPLGVLKRPNNISFDGAVVPDPKAELVFTRR